MRILSLLAAFVIAAGSLVVAPPQPADASAGFCSLASHGYYQMVVYKDIATVGGSYFDRVQGDASVVDLNICIGSSAGAGGSFVLPANVEGGGYILQLGYGKQAGRTDVRFYFANQSPDAIEIAGITPQIGTRYRFIIKRLNGTRFEIWRVSDNKLLWSLTSGYGWRSSYDLAWWGYETFDSFSAHGHLSWQPSVNMSYMGYSSSNSSSIWYRSGMGCSSIYKNFTWDGSGGNGCTGSHHGKIINWVYGGDGFDVVTD